MNASFLAISAAVQLSTGTLGGAILLMLAFVSWIMFIVPMKAEFAKWLTNPIPADWTRYLDQWKYVPVQNKLHSQCTVSLR